ncbi:MAG: DNA alkylation repair protein [Candidatus Buchananbacteria bacterium RIFCSPHIGHO2_01_FULL_44_11]|uniref:DNA alkylation repair protein n=1 Tax=Candidatus Buchananbacteria bacterium RIFCSPHIGHO2_01_FULL_44_11 TaxID=1797535 RepID=A0A1G1Y1Z8_9BACT|nr:MAG: DNA alkylation repair protein [Candidatus Buchananbacteria bacterium RIFCSPHIGHO2_01_FULL_44_11]
MARLNQLKTDLKKLASPRRAKISQRFFKTGSGQYGAGDIFWGLTNPQQRQVAKTYSTLSLPEIQALLKSKIHEQRQTALMILTNQYPKADQKSREKIFRFYLGQTKNINNWDLVDLSAPRIVGQHLLNKPRAILYRLARSKNLWPRRIAIVATYSFIKKGELTDTFKIAKLLLNDKYDLIHKATGWMLREAGKIDQKAEEKFLRQYHRQMPRTMLRYAIEKFAEAKRQKYLKGI